MKLARIEQPTRGLENIHEATLSANTYELIVSRLRHYATPVKGLTAATWSDKYRVLPAGGKYAKWDTSRTPYMYEIAEMMASSLPEHRNIVIAKSSQLGFTALSLGEILRLMHTQPTSILYYRETKEKIEEWRRVMLEPSLRLPPFNNRADIKMLGDEVYFPGGYVIARGTGSSNALAGTTARVIVGDEVAKFSENLEGEGDFFSLAAQRSSTFGDEGKHILLSTPKERSENEGSFYQLVQRGDCRKFCTPCQHCGKDWIWDVRHIFKYEEAGDGKFGLKCPECGEITRDGMERQDALQKGFWKKTRTPRPGFVSYEVSGMLSWRTLAEIYYQYEDATAGRGNMAAFMNSVLGEFYDEPEARRATPNEVQMRMTKQIYNRGEVPKGVCILTAGMDCQKDRIEWEVRGWGPKVENWSIDKGIIHHPIDKTQECMIALRALLAKDWKRPEDGKVMNIRLGAIDYGFKSSAVRALMNFFPRPEFDGKRVHVLPGTMVSVKGVRTDENPRLVMSTPGGRDSTGQRRRATFFGLGVDVAKRELYRALRAPEDSDEEIFAKAHAPIDYEQDYFRQIVGEEVLMVRNAQTGKVKQIFKPPPRQAVEALDNYVYARAAASILGADEWKEEDWLKIQARECRLEGEERKRSTASIREQREKIRAKRREIRSKRARKRRD